ncbi:MAG: serine/threonine protein kinase [Vulcanococcus sp.]
MSNLGPGDRIGERYRLEVELARGSQGLLWRASDQLAGEAPVVLRQLAAEQTTLQDHFRSLWPRLQGLLHPQVPRFGELIEQGGDLWLVREWQEGRTFAQLLQARRERQLVFGAGEVLLLLRQLLPVLSALHGQQLLHGDLAPANLLRRERDGLPVLLDFGLVRGTGLPGDGQGPIGTTPGYGPPELSRGESAEPWMDLYSLGVVSLVLLSGDEPAQLLDPVTLAWRWPACLDGEAPLRAALARLLSPDPAQRFRSAGAALEVFQAVPMPDSTGPVPRADRTVVLVPPQPQADPAVTDAVPAALRARVGAAGAAVAASDPAASAFAPGAARPSGPASQPGPQLPPTAAGPQRPSGAAAAPPQRNRQLQREEEAEGRLWPVVLALVVSAVVGTGLGWLLLSRGKVTGPSAGTALQLPSSLPPAEVDQRQQLLNRLRALQIDRGWFLKLVDASLLAQYPERGGRLPSDSLDDAPLRKVWNELAEEWLSRVEQLPLELRTRLGSFSGGDWQRRQGSLTAQGLSESVVEQLVSGSAQNLLPGRSAGDIPPEPFRQLWFAAAEKALANVRIEPIVARLGQTSVVSASVEASGARLFPIRLPGPSRLALGVNGSPLMQMTVFGADGRVLEARGPLRVVSLNGVSRSPVQLLVTNEGVAPALITLSLRPDPVVPEPAAGEPSASGVSGASGPSAQPLRPPARGSVPSGAQGSAPAEPAESPAAPLTPPPAVN